MWRRSPRSYVSRLATVNLVAANGDGPAKRDERRTDARSRFYEAAAPAKDLPPATLTLASAGKATVGEFAYRLLRKAGPRSARGAVQRPRRPIAATTADIHSANISVLMKNHGDDGGVRETSLSACVCCAATASCPPRRPRRRCPSARTRTAPSRASSSSRCSPSPTTG